MLDWGGASQLVVVRDPGHLSEKGNALQRFWSWQSFTTSFFFRFRPWQAAEARSPEDTGEISRNPGLFTTSRTGPSELAVGSLGLGRGAVVV